MLGAYSALHKINCLGKFNILFSLTLIDFQKILLSARVGHWTKILRWLGRDIIVVCLPLLVEVLRIVMNSIMLCFIRWFDLKTFFTIFPYLVVVLFHTSSMYSLLFWNHHEFISWGLPIDCLGGSWYPSLSYLWLWNFCCQLQSIEHLSMAILSKRTSLLSFYPFFIIFCNFL